jgi:hypothetical protein
LCGVERRLLKGNTFGRRVHISRDPRERGRVDIREAHLGKLGGEQI